MDCVLYELFVYCLCGLYECGFFCGLYLKRTCAVDCKMNICGLRAYFLWIVYLLDVDYV